MTDDTAPRLRWALPGSGHDDVVRASRRALPVAIGLLAVFLVMAPLTNSGDVSFLLDKNKVEVARERLRLQSAVYRGEDDKGRAFALLAGSAVQQRSTVPIVELNGLAARIGLQDGPARLMARRGQYDIERQQVRVIGPVRFEAANGYRLDTRDATVDLRTRKLASGGAVVGAAPQGQFSASRLDADLDERTVRLSGNARLRIMPGRAK